MAIDETELSKGRADTQGDDTPDARALPTFAADDFRLRLDSPLFHRDPGMVAAQAPQLRELTWEHVVRPTQQVSVVNGNAAPVSTPAVAKPSIESLLENALHSREPFDVVEQPHQVESLKPIEAICVDVPAVDVPAVDMAVPDMTVPDMAVPDMAAVELPIVQPASVEQPEALYSIDEDMKVLTMLPAAKLGAEALFAALEQMDEPQVAEPVVAVPIVEVPAAVAVAATVNTSPPAPVSAVEAELNRLAFLPDQEEKPGPVAVPTIAYAEPRLDNALPSLSQHERYTAQSSVLASQSRPNPVDVATTFTPVTRKKKRGGFARFATFLVFVAMLGGAAYAGKYYFLDKRWDGAVKALVSEVEAARLLSFDHAITVTTLPVADYASRLVTTSFGLDEAELEAESGGWRALGVLDGNLSVRQIGMSALPDSPAFYDPASETIFVAEGLPASLYRFGMHRALTLALLDQEFGWSGMTKGVSPAVARGTRAFYDADALATAVAMESLTQRTDIVKDLFGLYTEFKIELSPAPFASALAGRLGVALRPYFESITMADRGTLALTSPITDGQALDLRRLTAGAVESPSATAQGMLFWYHVLASRVDENTAWTAALAWQDDDVSVVQKPAGSCVAARIQVDQASLDSVSVAFQAWAAAAPPESATTVTVATDGTPMQLQISACDPGPGVSTNAGGMHLALGGAPLRAEQYRILMEGQPTVPATQAACAVNGGDSVSLADERGVIEDGNGWPAPANHPLPDPNRIGCAPA